MEQRFIAFETTLEPVETDMEQMAVKPIFTRIVKALEGRGAHVVEQATEWDSYGWYADFQVGSASITCMMQRSDSWLLVIDSNRSFMDRLKGRRYEKELSEFAELVVDAVHETIGASVKLFNSEAEFRAS